jgi:hypothetical protein
VCHVTLAIPSCCCHKSLLLLLLLLLLLQVDMVFWAVASGFLHGCSVARMLLDELPVR